MEETARGEPDIIIAKMRCKDSTVIVLVSLFLLLPYAILAPIIPLQLKNRKVNQVVTGLVFSIFALAWLIMPQITNKYLINKCGRRKLTQTGVAILSCSILLYALDYYITNPIAYAITILITRIFQGLGATISLTAFIALLPKVFPEQKGQAFSARYCGTTFGASLGISIASVAYALGGIPSVFVMIGCLSSTAICLLYCFPEPQDPHLPPSEPGSNNSFGWLQICKIKRTFCAFCTNAISDSFFLFIQPILALKLQSSYDKNSGQICLFLLAYLLSLVISTFISLSLPRRLEKRYLIILGNGLLTLGLILLGPSKLLHLPQNSSALMLVGLSLSGLGQGLSSGFMLEQAFNGAVQFHPRSQHYISDKVSSIYSTVYGIITLGVPILSSVLNQWLGYSRSVDMLMLLSFVNFIGFMGSSLLDIRREKELDSKFRLRDDQRRLLQ